MPGHDAICSSTKRTGLHRIKQLFLTGVPLSAISDGDGFRTMHPQHIQKTRLHFTKLELDITVLNVV